MRTPSIVTSNLGKLREYVALLLKDSEKALRFFGSTLLAPS